jgi:4-amino-4-deoxy-L-arabinose transferase-like glycosyltransferase
VLIGYIAAGVAVTWPLASYLRGRLPDIHDPASYVWSLWWVAHQVTHLGNPWFTPRLAAPVGVQLGYDTLMPLLGLLMLPVTLLAGAAVSYNLLVVLLPGVLCYVMYRVARLWLTSEAGAVAAGALFGLSTMVAFQDWFHLNIAAGTVFLPLALEAAVRLRRRPGIRRALRVGLVLGLAVLVNQESAIMAAILVLLALIPWVAAQPALDRLRDCGIAALTALVLASPQIAAMAWQASSGGTAASGSILPAWYRRLGAGLPTLFSPSPRLRSWGLGALDGGYHFPLSEGVPTFGITLTALALAGLVISWRRPRARLLGLLWLGSAVLAMGSAVKLGNTSYLPAAISAGRIRLSGLMPFTWLVHVPGLSAFREADRFTLLGLVPAALLAGSTVGWLAHRARPLLGRPAQASPAQASPAQASPIQASPIQASPIQASPIQAGAAEPRSRAVLPGALLLIAVLGAAAEAGWPGGGPVERSMPASLPALDGPIAADHSSSIVVDVPFGIRGGLPKRYGAKIEPESLALASSDGHPRAISYTSWIPAPTVRAVRRSAFYARLVAAQNGIPSDARQARLARAAARRMDVGWVLVWKATPEILHYLAQAGFRFDYRADGVSVYRPDSLPRGTP